jgi:hypothetical protein
MLPKPFLLSVVILIQKNQVIPAGAIHELRERLLALKIQVTFINFLIEPGNPISLSKAINQLLPRFTKTCNYLAITNVFPDLENEKFDELVQFHLQHQNQFVYYTDHEALTSLSEKRYWLGMKSYLWWETGGFCPFLGFPDNLFSEIVERSISKGLIRSDFKLGIEHSKYFSIYAEEPVKLIQRDEEYFNHIYAYQNYLQPKKPDFIVIGAQKSSSTSIIHTLAAILRSLPQQ